MTLRPALAPWLARWPLLVVLVGRLIAAGPGGSAPTKAADRFFQRQLVELDIRVSPEGWAALLEQTMESPKLYAEATVRSGGRTWRNVGIKLKGSYGSFQAAGERPGLTLHFDKFKGSERFHGLTRIHLNNSAQDESYLHEWLGAELARAAGVPAGRCTHAWVTLQGQPRGLYVLRESFTRDFLAEWFGPPGKGDLYDAGPGGDLRPEMDKDQGDPGEHEALQALIDAAGGENPEPPPRRLEAHLDLSRFHRFAAAEILLGHWDGYTLSANNYRLYRDPADGRFAFLLHGLDQLLGDPDAPVFPPPSGMIARAVLSTPEAWARLATEMQRQLDHAWNTGDWPRRIRDRSRQLSEAVATRAPDLAPRLLETGDDLAHRFEARRRQAAAAVGHPPRPVIFDAHGRAALAQGWHAAAGDETVPATREENALRLEASDEGAGAWQQTVLLPPGRYRLSARMETWQVVPTGDRSQRGVRIRASAAEDRGPPGLTGTRSGRTQRVSFEADGPVTLRLELRARSGRARFPLEGLVLEKR